MQQKKYSSTQSNAVQSLGPYSFLTLSLCLLIWVAKASYTTGMVYTVGLVREPGWFPHKSIA
jgi:hypothetical protein